MCEMPDCRMRISSDAYLDFIQSLTFLNVTELDRIKAIATLMLVFTSRLHQNRQWASEWGAQCVSIDTEWIQLTQKCAIGQRSVR